MPLLTNPNDIEQRTLASNHFGYSGTRIDSLGATEYTLATITVDVSGSVEPFRQQLEDCLVEMVKACRKNPRADNTMIRVTQFSDSLDQVNGFVPLPNLNPDDYRGKLRIGGCTSLYDASENAIEATADYGSHLYASEYNANGIVVIITDGLDNVSAATQNSVKQALSKAIQNESLESLMTILIGVNMQDSYAKKALEDFAQSVGFTQFVDAKDASASNLAKIANFVSQSISSQSQALGSGGPSQSLVF